ncbi:ABC transporter permease [Roseomonas frigidaquae]|uniref:ABC transporter permease n=1 Tax=Falsiroseomonas frigidaquae TaxID=487318 RepID=A0ABX1F1U8_9PROT|nr:ABC transporter permease [Falsiroseomonas frigidaquae]NKE46282.1 ABC transporter permease [Falsiroseomonas frigidaquae]
MTRALARQAGILAATFLGLFFVTFAIGRLMPLDPVLAVTGPDISDEIYQQVRAEMGLDDPIIVQFFRYTWQVARLDFGTSIVTRETVAADILRVFPATLELATAGTLIGMLIGVPAGIAAAVWRGGVVDAVVRVLTLVGYSAPVFWKGLMLLLVFYVWLGWVEGPGRIDVVWEGMVEPVTGIIILDAAMAGEWEMVQNAFGHLILPAVSLGYGAAAYIGRMTRSFMLDQMRQEYVTAARAKGLSELRIVVRHVLPNCAVQLITAVALTYGLLLEGAVLTETVFAWPGLGQYMTRAMFNADMNAVLGGTFVIGAVFVALNLAADTLYRVLDPRAG